MNKIYKLAVYVEGQEEPSFNGLRFATAEEANKYGADLASRWFLVTKYHPVLDVSEKKEESAK